MQVKLTAIVYREDLYPRFESSPALIQKYAYAVDNLPPIKLNQNMILIDGFHRWKAHQLLEKDEISVEIIETSSEKELKRLAYETNSNHGLQLSNEEKQKYAREMVGDMSVKELAEVLCVSVRTIQGWTESQRKAMEEEASRRLLELYLRAWHTQEEISTVLDMPKQTVSDKIKQISEIGNFAEIGQTTEKTPNPILADFCPKGCDMASHKRGISENTA